ncbi:MAG: FAD binding domain-containing protein [Candidatus Baldrarchaeia archaeon]
MLPKFKYLQPKSLEEALELLDKYGEQAKLLAGGTDLIVKMKDGVVKPEYVIDLSRLEELKFISKENGVIKIGALTTLREIETSPIIRENVHVLSDAVEKMASWQIRNLGTIGGNLCNASPAADTAPPLLVLEAELKLTSSEGGRMVPIDQFFTGPGETILKNNELLTEIQIPIMSDHIGTAFLKLGRRVAHTLSIVSVATLVVVEDDVFKDVRIALGSVAPTPVRAKKTEDRFRGLSATKDVVEKNCVWVVEDISPISDVRASAEYRKEMSIVLTKRALIEALDEVR